MLVFTWLQHSTCYTEEKVRFDTGRMSEAVPCVFDQSDVGKAATLRPCGLLEVVV